MNKSFKPNLVAVAVAGASLLAGQKAEGESRNYLKRLESLTTHPKVPDPIKTDVRRLLDAYAAVERRNAILEQQVTDLEAVEATKKDAGDASQPT